MNLFGTSWLLDRFSYWFHQDLRLTNLDMTFTLLVENQIERESTYSFPVA
ncbi:Uncharacterized protein APZ42_031681 [Daphnia magna]|uniref:Uncharacterized protein n=1 Tax=Daphnia magna TaxID=35525 RepID=A0A164MJS1_9CRUS|nr:Uncharacterized protein APZ42_031681 [Daphnia magna]